MTTHYQEVKDALSSFGPGAVVTIREVLDRIDTQRWSNVRACRVTIVSRYMRMLAYEGRVTKISECRPARTAALWRVEKE